MQILISKISLTNFRNHSSFDFVPKERLVAIIGRNGVGKTNILEAISLLYAGRGMRSAKLQEMKQFGVQSAPWVIYAEVEGLEGEVKIGTSLDYTQSGKEKRRVRINAEEQRGNAILAEHFSYIALTPMQDQVFSLGASSRRDYLDKLCEVFYPDYEDFLAVYDISKSERRKLLLAGNYDEFWVNSLEQRMAERAIAIAYCRLELCELLNSFMQQAEESGFPQAVLAVEGEVENFIKTGAKAIEVEDFFKRKLFDNRNFDAASKRTNFGVHKSDMRVVHKLKNVPAEFCSQGEQKAMLLSITIACILAKKARTGFYPVLLLDEVASHLDEDKRKKLYNFISKVNCQTWLTSTEKSHFEGLKDVEFLEL